MAKANATKATLTGARARASARAGRKPRAAVKKPRRDWRARFLAGFAKFGSVRGGCVHAGIHHSTAYRERQRSEKLALAWADIEQGVTDELEETALKMALAGEVRLLEFMLRARRPEVYREHHLLEHTGPGGRGPVELIDLGVDLSRLTDAELKSLQRLVTRATPQP